MIMSMEESSVEKKVKKGRYPRSVLFIIGNEFCERFSYYGIRAELSLYASTYLMLGEKNAATLFHIFVTVTFFFPVFGAMIADSLLGRYRTILYLSSVYAVGQLCLTASAVPTLHLPAEATTYLGLLLIAVGSGGIKPCVSAFGGDQFQLPQQETYLASFFSFFYFAISTGSLLSIAIAPFLRADVTCFGETTCYPLVFFVPSVLMIISIGVFFCGKSLYRIKNPTDNVILNVGKCMTHAISQKIKSRTKRDHWMDHADDHFDKKFINDVKAALGVLYMFIPLPFFWTLFDQQGSYWVFQATRMNGEVLGRTIHPDHTQILGPLLIVFLIPMFQAFFYPLLSKYFYLNTSLKKLACGGILAAVSFIVSGMVELHIEKTYAKLPVKGFAQLRVYNSFNCSILTEIGDQEFELLPLSMWQNISIAAEGSIDLKYHFNFEKCLDRIRVGNNDSGILRIYEAKATSLRLTRSGFQYFQDNVEKSPSGDPIIRPIINNDLPGKNLSLRIVQTGKFLSEALVEFEITNDTKVGQDAIVKDDYYDVYINEQKLLSDQRFKFGGVFSILGRYGENGGYINLVTVTDPNSVSMLWLLPQYVIITIGELMFSVTGLEFAYSQSPASMKSLLQACWLLTIAFGNLYIVLISETVFFERRVYEIFLFALLMLADMGIFISMARHYKYVSPDQNKS